MGKDTREGLILKVCGVVVDTRFSYHEDASMNLNCLMILNQSMQAHPQCFELIYNFDELLPSLGRHSLEIISNFTQVSDKHIEYLMQITILYSLISSQNLEVITVLIEHGRVIENYQNLF
jgi:hypothetical protein